MIVLAVTLACAAVISASGGEGTLPALPAFLLDALAWYIVGAYLGVFPAVV